MFKIQGIILSKQHILVQEETFSTKKERMKPAYTENPVLTHTKDFFVFHITFTNQKMSRLCTNSLEHTGNFLLCQPVSPIYNNFLLTGKLSCVPLRFSVLTQGIFV